MTADILFYQKGEKMATPKKQKNGRWRVQVYIGTTPEGKSIIRTVTADTKAECMYKASVLKHEGITEIHDKITVREAVEQYIISIENVISPNTLRGYNTILNNYFKQLMEWPVDKLTNLTVQAAINEESKRITRRGNQISPKAIQNGYGLIETALRKVCGRTFDVKLPQLNVKIKEFPEPEEIVQAIRGTNSELPCLLAMWLGLRMGEVKGLDCSSVRDGVLHIEQTRIYKDGKELVKPTAKNDKSIRNIQIPPYLLVLIERSEEYKNYKRTGKNGPLIPTPRNRIYKRWKKIAEAHGWEMTFHDLRAVNASIALILGVPDKYMMQRNGYKTDYTYKKTYQQTFSSNRRAADRMIDEYFEQMLY